MHLPSLLTRRQFNLTSLASLGLSLTGLGGCKKKKSSKFIMGVLSPKTGADSQVGISCEHGAKLAAELLKELNLDIDLLYGDTESSVDQGRTKAERLIGQGAHLLIGAHHSGVTSAIAQVCEQRQIPLVVNISASPDLTRQGYQYLFRNFPTTENLAENGLNLMEKLFNNTKTYPHTAAILHINDTYGKSMCESFVSGLSRHVFPFKILDLIRYDPRTQDLSSEVGRIKSCKADLLIPITRLNDAILMLRECIKQRYHPMGIISPGSPGMYEKQFYKTLGTHSDYCITNTAWYDPTSLLYKKAAKSFYQMFPHSQFDLNVAFTFEAVWLAADAYRRAETNDREALKEALKTTYITERLVYGGPISFDSEGQAKNIGSLSVQNFRGEPKIILPSELAQQNPIFPFPSWQKV